jgi:FkbM family methyltransferase
MTGTTKGELAAPSPQAVVFTGPFETPVTRMGELSWAAYRLKWAIGHRLIGENSWAWKVRKRLGFQRWVLSHVHGWPHLVLWRAGIRRPFTATLAGKKYEVIDEAQKLELSRQIRRTYNPFPFREAVSGDGTGVFSFSFAGKGLEFGYGRDRFGSQVVLTECFVYEYFSGLDVEGRVVIDVGSSIGDTPVYFAVRGARKVIAFEPYPATYARARYNISLNGLDDRIALLNEGGGASGLMKLARADMNLWANAVPSPEGEVIRFNSLRDVVTRFEIDDAVLKYHGEGSEYEFFGKASTEDLRRFSQIAMKYHYGGKQIIRKLERSGFSIVRTWDLHFSYNASSSNPRYEAGLVLAKRIDPPR